MKNGQFDSLQHIPYLRHGFSDGYPTIGFQNGVNTEETIQAHKDFLRDYGMEPYKHALIMRADGTPFVSLDEVPEKDSEVPFYGYIRAECIVTSVHGYSINIKLADCAGFVGTTVTKSGEPLLFIFHGSRNTLAQQAWIHALQEAQKKYQFDPSDIRGGVTPHMCMKCHTLQNLEQLPNAEQWKSEGIVTRDTTGLWHFDSTSLLKKQLEEGGVNVQNITVDNRCTYEVYTQAIEGGEQPPIFSHRAYTDHASDPRFFNGRFVLSGMIL